MTERTRINLDESISGRAPIDAAWSPRKKKIVAGLSIAMAASAALGGVWWTVATSAPRLPKTASEAVIAISSERFDRLDEARRRQYISEAARLLRDLSDEERRAMFQDEANRDVFRTLREERFDEVARAFARGERPNFGGFGGPRDGRRAEGGRPGFDPANVTPEDRAARLEQMRERMTEQVASDAESGNAQEAGLRAEMNKRISRSGGGGFGGGGRRGG